MSQDNGNEGSDSGLDSPTETTTAREMEHDEFKNIIRQLHHEIASLHPTSKSLPISSHRQRLTRAIASQDATVHSTGKTALSHTLPASTHQITVTTNQHVDVTEWLLPPNICQSTIAGSLIGSIMPVEYCFANCRPFSWRKNFHSPTTSRS